MNEQTCESCKHFYQHYVKGKKDFRITDFGHCGYPRIKIRKVDTPACQHFCEKIQKE